MQTYRFLVFNCVSATIYDHNVLSGSMMGLSIILFFVIISRSTVSVMELLRVLSGALRSPKIPSFGGDDDIGSSVEEERRKRRRAKKLGRLSPLGCTSVGGLLITYLLASRASITYN